jgi:CBS domain containing-hemolysin-like protein
MQPIHLLESVNIALKDQEFIDHAVETSRSRIPVYEGEKSKIIGYIHIKDILAAWRHDRKDFAKTLIRRPTFIDEDMRINDILKEFQRGKTHIAFIKNKADKVEGFLALEDILEEVVGEIVDEYERA